MSFPVKLYVYEVTQGMAKGISMGLLGRQIEGVWHTGITVYGNEYFFGSFGIENVPLGSFMLGPPTEIVDLGNTEIPQELFKEYLNELSQTTYMGVRYHLLHHNCNTFSNEVAMFLTGNTIPEKITNLPNEVMSTPFGQMLLPFIDSMMNQFNQKIHMNASSSHLPSTSSSQASTSSVTATFTSEDIKAAINAVDSITVSKKNEENNNSKKDQNGSKNEHLDLD